MLTFLRKHQKYFFIVITVVIVITFSFFGTQSITRQGALIKDKEIGKAVDGSKMMLSDVEKLSLFLSNEADSIYGRRNNAAFNLFNDGVISKDFIDTGMASLLVSTYFEALQSDLENNFNKVKKTKFYVHREAPFISARECWKQYNPELLLHLDKVLKMGKGDLAFFKELTSLYELEKKFPPELLRRILYFQQKERFKDEEIEYRDFSLFGFNNISDWFGKNFVDVVSQFILNAALIAEEKGYKVSKEEVVLDLMKNMNDCFKKYEGLSRYFPNDSKDRFYYQIRILGISEKDVIKLWQRVLLFRKYFEDVAQNIFTDMLPYENFIGYMTEKAEVELYKLPDYLQFKDFTKLLKFELYLRAVSLNKDLPIKYLKTEEVEKKFPELVEKVFAVKVSEVRAEEAGLKIGEKELWKWQLKDENWEELKDRFSELLNAKDRFKKLESLPLGIRADIDAFSRSRMVEQDPSFIEKAFLDKEPREMVLHIRSKGGDFPLKGIRNKPKLMAFLEGANGRKIYSENKKDFYIFEVITKSKDKKIITFIEALADKTIDKLLDSFLKKEYVNIRHLYPKKFKNEREQWKTFAEVREEVGAIVFKLKPESIRLLTYMNRALLDLKKGKKDFVIKEGEERDLSNQWKLEESKAFVSRKDPDEWFKSAFLKKKGELSSVRKDNGNLAFFIFCGCKKDEEAILKEVMKGKEEIMKQAKEELSRKVLSSVTPYIYIPLKRDV